MKFVYRAALFAALTSIPSFAAAATVGHSLTPTTGTPEIAATVPRATFSDLGHAAPDTPVSIVITLAYRNPAQLQALIDLQNDEHSPYYRHWLTSAQFNAAFAPTSLQYAKVIRSLQSAGFRVTGTYSNRTIVDATGTVLLAERYFGTRIDRVVQPRHGTRYANVTPAYVPTELHGLVYAVSGLQDMNLLHTGFRPVRPGTVSTESLRRYAGAKAQIFGPISTVTGTPGYTPLAFIRAYDFPVSHDAKYDGRGSNSAIIIDADFKDSDLAGFLSSYQIKRSGPATRRVIVSGGDPSQTPGGSSVEGSDNIETTLDVESLVGTSPGTALWVYEVPDFQDPDSTQGVVNAFNKVVADNKVDSVNTSFGACENADLSYSEALDHAAQQGAALGITFHASTGDLGAYACQNASTGTATLSVNIPASSPNVVAVGGTTLIVNATGAFQGEYGWNSGSVAVGQSGGGVSDVFLLPRWQRGVPNLNQAARNLPDISFAADPLTGLALYYFGSWNNQWNPIGGTSLASPIFGGAVAQMVQVTGGRLGLAASKLFTLWKSTGYAKGDTVYFHDSIFGSNTFYVAGPGYDNVTGIGSVDIWNAARALKK